MGVKIPDRPVLKGKSLYIITGKYQEVSVSGGLVITSELFTGVVTLGGS